MLALIRTHIIATMKRLRQDFEELKQENTNLKLKIESQQTEIGRFINERNEQGEMKSKLITLNDKLSRKDTEILEYQNKVAFSSFFSLPLHFLSIIIFFQLFLINLIKLQKLQKDLELLQIQVNNTKALSSEHNELISQLEQKVKEKEKLVNDVEQKFHVSLKGIEIFF